MKKVSTFVEQVTNTLVSTLLNGMTVETVEEKKLIREYLTELDNLLGDFNIIYTTRFPEDLIVHLPVYINRGAFESTIEEFIEKLDDFYPYVESLPELASIVTDMLKLSGITLFKYKRV